MHVRAHPHTHPQTLQPTKTRQAPNTNMSRSGSHPNHTKTRRGRYGRQIRTADPDVARMLLSTQHGRGVWTGLRWSPVLVRVKDFYRDPPASLIWLQEMACLCLTPSCVFFTLFYIPGSVKAGILSPPVWKKCECTGQRTPEESGRETQR